MNSPPSDRELRVFVCYANEDKDWLCEGSKDLIPYLQGRLSADRVSFWWDRGIRGGDEWEKQIYQELERADIALALISGNLINSSFAMNKELPLIQARHALGELVVIPILLTPIRNARGRLSWIFGLQVMPGQEVSLAHLHENEESWHDIREQIADLLEQRVQELRLTRPRIPAPDPGAVPHAPVSEMVRERSIKPRKTRWVKPWMAAIVLLALVAGGVYWKKRTDDHRQFAERCAAFHSAAPWIKWVVYDPSGNYDPVEGRFPPESSIRKDMETLVQWGVKGVITMGSRDVLGAVPRMAKESGIIMVIAGVWDPADYAELQNAIHAKAYVDAYCIGHRVISRGAALNDLLDTIQFVRERTQRPVTFSERLSTYGSDPTLAARGDFFFPDCALNWFESAETGRADSGVSPESAYRQVVQRAREAAQLSRDSTRTILMKMLGYPSAGNPNFTEDAQAAFFRLVTTLYDDEVDVPANVHLSFMTAFDPAWKSAALNWEPCEQHSGLLDLDRRAKPAAAIFRDWIIAK